MTGGTWGESWTSEPSSYLFNFTSGSAAVATTTPTTKTTRIGTNTTNTGSKFSFPVFPSDSSIYFPTTTTENKATVSNSIPAATSGMTSRSKLSLLRRSHRSSGSASPRNQPQSPSGSLGAAGVVVAHNDGHCPKCSRPTHKLVVTRSSSGSVLKRSLGRLAGGGSSKSQKWEPLDGPMVRRGVCLACFPDTTKVATAADALSSGVEVEVTQDLSSIGGAITSTVADDVNGKSNEISSPASSEGEYAVRETSPTNNKHTISTAVATLTEVLDERDESVTDQTYDDSEGIEVPLHGDIFDNDVVSTTLPLTLTEEEASGEDEPTSEDRDRASLSPKETIVGTLDTAMSQEQVNDQFFTKETTQMSNQDQDIFLRDKLLDSDDADIHAQTENNNGLLSGMSPATSPKPTKSSDPLTDFTPARTPGTPSSNVATPSNLFSPAMPQDDDNDAQFIVPDSPFAPLPAASLDDALEKAHDVLRQAVDLPENDNASSFAVTNDEVRRAIRKFRSAAKNESTRICIIHSDVCSTLVSVALSASSNASIRKECCHALRIIASDDSGAEAIAEAGAVRAVVYSMGRHRNNAGVQEEGCGALRALSRAGSQPTTPEIREDGDFDEEEKILVEEQDRIGTRIGAAVAVVEAGGILAIVDAMKKHEASASVQRRACGALYYAAIDPDGRTAILNAGGIYEIICAMRTHGSVVAESGCAALQNLAYEETAAITIGELGGVQVLLDAMKNNPYQVRVQELGSVALCNLCFVPVNVREMRREGEDAIEILKEASQRFPSQCSRFVISVFKKLDVTYLVT